MAVEHGRPRHLNLHVERVRRESRQADLPAVSVQSLRSTVASVIRLNREASCVLRLGWLVERGKARPFVLCEPPRAIPGHIVLQLVHAAGAPLGGYAKGQQLFRWQSLRDQAGHAGVFDVLLVREGFLTETSRFNLFLDLDGRLCTPPDREVFCGIARRALLDDAKVKTRVVPLQLSQLAAASRVLLVNSVRRPLEVSRVLDSAGGTVWPRQGNAGAWSQQSSPGRTDKRPA